ncbi:TerD family protein [Streptomyces sp. NPDC060011]|uniref:TerD family protein n=1 Tax=unclassified Streptomyces TaxID=2593676 RepID=UPI0013BC7D20|nr:MULTISPECIES: TerD family protein [unclassified Streptomyces]MCX4919410.1 TerD family protein [Streptomyces sp. NBC_00687]MCX5134462.1 TerD family protein [Streptomyces sp. NBC_00340]MCX5281391.1 TerD family protein [Streptomyces sp. NBC_00198]NEB35075.1 TerD family protein [Streptomyces sp. SID14446]WSD75437.1 TerD family protein [Streptomyces sp. NBC_01558]
MGSGEATSVSGVSRGLAKVQVKLRWDPSPWGEAPRHLDIMAATYSVEEPYGRPVYVVHTESRSPDGTINMSRHSETGVGLGFVEVMVLELDRLASSYARVVVGVAIHQDRGVLTFGDIRNAGVLVVEDYRELMTDDLSRVAGSNATTIAEFTRDGSGAWSLQEAVRGFDGSPTAFAAEMGNARQR